MSCYSFIINQIYIFLFCTIFIDSCLTCFNVVSIWQWKFIFISSPWSDTVSVCKENQLEISFPYISFYCSLVIVLCHSMENDALWCLVELCYFGMIVIWHLHLVLNFYSHQLGCHYWYTNMLESFFPFFCSISLFGMAFSAPDIERWDKNFPCIVHG